MQGAGGEGGRVRPLLLPMRELDADPLFLLLNVPLLTANTVADRCLRSEPRRRGQCRGRGCFVAGLTSAEANAITGINLTVDGGFTIKGIAQLDPGSSIDRAATMCEPK